MLAKPQLLSLLTGTDADFFRVHWDRILLLKHAMDTQQGDKWIIPSCHHIAHAYAQAYGVDVVDGEKITVATTKTWVFDLLVTVRMHRYTHSWNLVTLPSGRQVIIDLFPDECCSLFPIVVLHPHPAYTVHPDLAPYRSIQAMFERPGQTEQLSELVATFKRITE